MGKIMFGGLGGMIGGPVGAILGAVIGHKLFDSGTNSTQRISTNERSQAIFFVNFVSCLAKMAKADGRICEKEIQTVGMIFEKQLGLTGEGKQVAINIFNAAKDNSDPIEEYLRQLRGAAGYNPAIGMTFIAALHAVAMADGILANSEKEILVKTEQILGLRSGTANNLFGNVDDIDAMYEILEATADMSDQEIKKKHRQKSLEYHPDKLISKGLPEEFMKYANDEMVKINKAYDAIKKSRGMK